MTQEEQKEYWKEEEKKTHIEVYRADYFEGTVELVKEVDNGFVVAVNDDIGVYYYEFAGDGLANGIKLYHWNPEEEKEEVVLDRGFLFLFFPVFLLLFLRHTQDIFF